MPNPSCETKFLGANGDGEIFIFPCSADHEQDWKPYPVDPSLAIYVMTIHTYIHTYIYLHQLIGTDSRNTQQLRRLRILSFAMPDCTYVRNNPHLAVRMIFYFILFFMSPSLRSSLLILMLILILILMLMLILILIPIPMLILIPIPMLILILILMLMLILILILILMLILILILIPILTYAADVAAVYCVWLSVWLCWYCFFHVPFSSEFVINTNIKTNTNTNTNIYIYTNTSTSINVGLDAQVRTRLLRCSGEVIVLILILILVIIRV